MTAEQLEASRSERMRQNGHGTTTLEDARTWIEETGFCYFLPKRQFAPTVAPSFVEAVTGKRDATPDPKQIALAEELLVRLENDGVVVRLNLQGVPGEQPDYVVASWVLPYVYALRGDRDWRRSPQLTGSRQVSPLAVQTYKLLEAGDTTVSSLRHTLGREVTEAAVLRAITELWQQLRIIPTISAPGQPAKWQLLRQHYQKAIAEGASTSQVTAISVLASIYLQAVIATTMEDVEIFLSPLTARSKVREVLRALVATRQVHTIALGHAPHFYVAGTLPEFNTAPTYYASSSITSSYFLGGEREEESSEFVFRELGTAPEPTVEPAPVSQPVAIEAAAEPVSSKPAPAVEKPHARFSRPAAHVRDRKPAAQPSHAGHYASGHGESRASSSRPASAHGHASSSSRWTSSAPTKSSGGKRTTSHGSSSAARPAGNTSARSSKPASLARKTKPAPKAQHSAAKPVSKSMASSRKSSSAHGVALARGGSRKPALTSASRAGAKKRG